MNCLIWIILPLAIVFVMVSMIRWFEQVTEAVEQRWWNKVFVLVAMPLTVWLFPSRVSAGRPTAVPLHEPVRGFGLPKGKPGDADTPTPQPPPGTPPEFIGPPIIQPKKPRAPIDPEQVAKLRQKMREQGMLDNDDRPTNQHE